jgi:CheY-like chemotaxis protein
MIRIAAAVALATGLIAAPSALAADKPQPMGWLAQTLRTAVVFHSCTERLKEKFGYLRMTKTVLVVDDDPTQRRLIQAVLEREGFTVAHAESGDDALKKLAAGAAADVVLLDLVMPGMSGQDTLAEMPHRGFNQPVIVLTATGGVDTVVRPCRPAPGLLRQARLPERIWCRSATPSPWAR